MFSFFDFNINFGGAPKGSVALCSALKKAGASVMIHDAYGANEKYISEIYKNEIELKICCRKYKKTYIGGRSRAIRLLNIILQLPVLLKVSLSLRKSANSKKIRLFWVNNAKSLFFLYIGLVGQKIPIVYYHRGWARASELGKIKIWIIKRFSRLLIAHSYATVENLKELFPNKEIIYVPNSVAIKESDVRLEETIINKSGRIHVILPAARPVYEKGHHTAIASIALLKSRGVNNIDLILPGERPVGDSNDYYASLKKYIKSSGLEENIRFVGWIDDLASYIKSCDLVILPSHTEGFPRVIIEAMLLGTPVIATPVGGIPEAIINGETGFIIPKEDSEALADAIEYVICHKPEVEMVISKAKSFASQHFSSEIQVDRVKEAFSRAISSNKTI